VRVSGAPLPPTKDTSSPGCCATCATKADAEEAIRREIDEGRCGFDAHKIAQYDDRKVQELLANPEIVRNRLKIRAAIQNACAFLELQSQYGSFDAFLWRFVGGQPIQNAWQTLQEIPASTRESDAVSKELKRQGFSFVGTTICYALMQAMGMVNDHTVECFRWQELQLPAQ
jgi:DNA-3-methyladenine glycosylase I